jgi:CheY-like chemotaxis protein
MQDGLAASGGLRILLVDDEALVRAGTAMMLDELGHAVLEAGSGKQGLELLAEDGAIDLLMTDFNMPDMDGMEMIDLARQAKPDLAVVLITGYDADDPRFAELHAVNLGKPFGLDELEVAIHTAVAVG